MTSDIHVTTATATTWSKSGELAFVVPSATTHQPPVLAERWICRETGESRWERVKTFAIEPREFDQLLRP